MPDEENTVVTVTKTILLLDDVELDRAPLADFLRISLTHRREEGMVRYIVEEFSDAIDACARIVAGGIDVVVSDICLWRGQQGSHCIDGRTVASIARNKGIPILLYSGHASEVVGARRDHQADLVLEKPLNTDHLVRAIQSLAEDYRQRH